VTSAGSFYPTVIELAPNQVTLGSVVISLVALGYLAATLFGAIQDGRYARGLRDWLGYFWVVAPAVAALWFVWSGTFREVTLADPTVVDLPCDTFYQSEDRENYDACIEAEYGERFDREQDR